MTDREEELQDLVKRAQGGERAAIGALYDRLAARVYRFALFRVGNRPDAEDLMQRTFLKMIEALPRYRLSGIPFEAWLFRVARNGAVDLLRARRSHEPLETAVETHSTEPGPEVSAELAVEFATVERALRSLTPEQQDVIAYRFMAELSPREVGRIMGKREGAVRALQFRALELLRAALGPSASPDGGVADELEPRFRP